MVTAPTDEQVMLNTPPPAMEKLSTMLASSTPELRVLLPLVSNRAMAVLCPGARVNVLVEFVNRPGVPIRIGSGYIPDLHAARRPSHAGVAADEVPADGAGPDGAGPANDGVGSDTTISCFPAARSVTRVLVEPMEPVSELRQPERLRLDEQVASAIADAIIDGRCPARDPAPSRA